MAYNNQSRAAISPSWTFLAVALEKQGYRFKVPSGYSFQYGKYEAGDYISDWDSAILEDVAGLDSFKWGPATNYYNKTYSTNFNQDELKKCITGAYSGTDPNPYTNGKYNQGTAGQNKTSKTGNSAGSTSADTSNGNGAWLADLDDAARALLEAVTRRDWDSVNEALDSFESAMVKLSKRS